MDGTDSKLRDLKVQLGQFSIIIDSSIIKMLQLERKLKSKVILEAVLPLVKLLLVITANLFSMQHTLKPFSKHHNWEQVKQPCHTPCPLQKDRPA